MNARTRKLTTLAAVVLTSCLFFLEQTTFAQSPIVAVSAGRPIPNAAGGRRGFSDCKQAKGDWFDSINLSTGGTTGTIRNGGILNGTTETVYDPAFVFTPDPNVVSYIADLTITTHQGKLMTSNVYIYNVVTGLWTAMGRINPDTSTERFAGASGLLYFNGKTIGVFPDQSYPSDIAGEICFANE